MINHNFPSVLDINANDIGIRATDTAYDVKTPDGDLILKVFLTLPDIHVVSNDALQASIQDALAEAQLIFTDRIKHLSEIYLSDFSVDKQFFCTPRYSVTYTITDYSENSISLLFSVTETNADGMIGHSQFCRVIDLSAGFCVDISTLFTDGISQGLLSAVYDTLQKSGYTLYSTYQSIVASEIGSSWLITDDRVAFVFSPGTIASADQGMISITIEKERLRELCSEYGNELFGFRGGTGGTGEE